MEGARGLGRFLAALRRVEREGGLVRVTHLGDSSIGMDDLPHALRTRFQSRFGDGGPGFVILPASSSQVLNRTIAMRTTSPWDDVCEVIDRCERDGHYGLGGVRVETRGGGDTLIRPRDGRPVRRAELWYAAQPGGGRLRFHFGGQLADVETAGSVLEDRWHVLTASEAGEHAVRVAAAPGGVSRGYGVVLENDGPGVVWDSLSLVGAFTPRLLAHDEAHFARQLAHRDPDLVVLNFGGNDLRRLIGGRVSEAGLADETHRLLRRVREAVPEAGCLLVGINDHQRSGEADVEAEHVEAVVRAQRAAAERAGCAHYPTLDAMGGAGSFSRWYAAGLGAFDRKHLSPRGRDVLAARIHAALLHAGGLTPR